MTNQVSSFPAQSNPPPLRRHGGRLPSTPELAIHPLGDNYLVEGAGSVTALPSWPKGPPILLHFVGTVTFVASWRLLMPGGQNYTFASGDTAWLLPLGDVVWRVIDICRADGVPFVAMGSASAAARQNIGALSEFAAIASAKAYGSPVHFPGGEAFGFISSSEMSAGASTSATLDIMNGQIAPTSAVGTQISQPTGIAIGGYANGGGLAAAFDGTTNQSDTGAGVSVTATTQYVGKNYTSAPKQVALATFYPSNQSGYCANTTSTLVTLNLRAKQTAPSSSSDGLLLATASVGKSSTSATTLVSGDQATAWNYVWVESVAGASGNFTVAELQFFPPGTTPNMEAVLAPLSLPAAATQARVLVEYSQKLVTGAGAGFGDLTINGGIGSLFDGVTSVPDSGAAVKTSATTAYAGQQLASAAVIASAVVFPSSQSGFADSGAVVSFNMRAKHTAPSSSSDGTLLATGMFASASQSDPVSLSSTDTTTAWEYVWVEMTATAATDFCAAEIQFYTYPTPNTELTASVSLDAGAHYTSVPLTVVGRGRRGRLLAEAAFTTITNGGAMAVLKFNTANSKPIAVHGALFEVR
jgi:hypothetical protein